MSSRDSIVAVGLCGELNISIRVRGVIARAHLVPRHRVIRIAQRDDDRACRRSARSPGTYES